MPPLAHDGARCDLAGSQGEWAPGSIGRVEFAGWSFPVIADLVFEEYARHLGRDHPHLMLLARCHAILWQALIAQDFGRVAEVDRTIGRYLRSAGLSAAIGRDLHDQVLDELVDVIAQRYHRSPQLMRECSQVLLKASRHLASLPPAA